MSVILTFFLFPCHNQKSFKKVIIPVFPNYLSTTYVHVLLEFKHFTLLWHKI